MQSYQSNRYHLFELYVKKIIDINSLIIRMTPQFIKIYFKQNPLSETIESVRIKLVFS